MTQTDRVKVEASQKFWLGKFYMTSQAQSVLRYEEVLLALRRHHDGDWGDVCPDDRQANESALANGGRLFSVYHAPDGTKFWIVTEADRSMTTVLLPDDY